MGRTVFATIVIVAVATVSGLSSDDADPITGRLDKAQAAYAADLESARSALLALIQREATAAQDAGSLDRLKKAMADREGFAERGELPKSVSTTEYLSAMAKARDRLEVAYTQARKEFTKAGKVTEAEAVDAELDRLKKNKTKSAPLTPKMIPKEPIAKRIAAREKLSLALVNTKWNWVERRSTLMFHTDGTAIFRSDDSATIALWNTVDDYRVLLMWPSNDVDILVFSPNYQSFSRDYIGRQDGRGKESGQRLDQK